MGFREVALGAALLISALPQRAGGEEPVSATQPSPPPPSRWELLPHGLLWTVPLANPREPRMSGRYLHLHGHLTVDTAIGGVFSLARLRPARAEGATLQLDGFGVVFSRFGQQRRLSAVDFRAGLPLSWARGPWQAKLAYEHTSAHLGDEIIEDTGVHPAEYVREEIVLGLAHGLGGAVRVYGQLGYSLGLSRGLDDDRDRFGGGLEWTPPSRSHGRPFAALDLEVKAEHEHRPDATLQAGWRWWGASSTRASRLALELRTGRSPFGQLYREKEDWISWLGYHYDW